MFVPSSASEGCANCGYIDQVPDSMQGILRGQAASQIKLSNAKVPGAKA